MYAIGRRKVLLGAAALALVAACDGGASVSLTEDDVVLGNPDAPVTLIEYASTTCPHCAEFHEAVWEQLRTNYIDTGRIRFVFREMPTPPPAVAVAGFQVARCGGATPEQYFDRVGEMFRQQQAMFATGSMEGIRAKLLEIGGAAGLSEAQLVACINDQTAAERIRRIGETARALNIDATPTLVLNGRKLEDPAVMTYEGLARVLDAELAG